MNTSEQYHQSVLEALCAFVRDGIKADIDPAADIQVAITVIGRRAAGTGVVDLTRSHISKANLSYADLRGANLRDADLDGANLGDANLGDANLGGTNVSQSQLDKACGNKGTTLPSGLTLKPCIEWPRAFNKPPHVFCVAQIREIRRCDNHDFIGIDEHASCPRGPIVWNIQNDAGRGGAQNVDQRVEGGL